MKYNNSNIKIIMCEDSTNIKNSQDNVEFSTSKESKESVIDPLAKFQLEKNETENIGKKSYPAGNLRSTNTDSKLISDDPCINAIAKTGSTDASISANRKVIKKNIIKK